MTKATVPALRAETTDIPYWDLSRFCRVRNVPTMSGCASR
jgi:hypothetical protein